MKFSELTEQQQLIIQPAWREEYPGLPLADLDNECPTELWRYFISVESDPEECMALYYALFEPNHQVALDIFDECFNLLLKFGIAGDYAKVLAATGRTEELLAHLKSIVPKKYSALASATQIGVAEAEYASRPATLSPVQIADLDGQDSTFYAAHTLLYYGVRETIVENAIRALEDIYGVSKA